MAALRSVPRLSRLGAGIVVALAVFVVVGWLGVSTVGREGGNDAGEHLRYAIYLDEHGRLPSPIRNYEYATPPLFHAASVGLERAVHRLPSVAAELPSNPLNRALWLALVGAGAACMTSVRPRRRLAGLAGLGLAVVWGLDEAVSLAKSKPWSGGQLLAFAACLGLVVVTGLIAREVWPGRPRLAVGAAAFVAAYPVVFRMGILFHPEMQLAFLSALATLLFLRAVRLGWPARLGWALGATCAAALLTRQTAMVAVGCILVCGVVIGRRRAAGFLARAALVVVVVVAPWWVYAIRTWHNPLQSNLDRPGLMMSTEPLGFYLTLPLRTLVIHPYRSDFDNVLLPKLHADLWSDWFGPLHEYWRSPSTFERIDASTQSVLGLAGDALALAGLAWLAVPRGVRMFRRRARPSLDEVPLGFLAFLALAGFAAFLVMLLRFPQRQGDPIKASYLLFTAPCWAVFSVAAWLEVVRRRVRVQAALVGLVALYAVSYGADLGATFARPSFWSGNNGIETLGAIDMSTSIQASAPTAYPGSEVDFAVIVNNNGIQTGSDLMLTVELAPGMKLLGPPYFERGTGCKGTTTLRCDLGFLGGQASTLIRFAVQVPGVGISTVKAFATTAEADAHPSDNGASFGLFVTTGQSTTTTLTSSG